MPTQVVCPYCGGKQVLQITPSEFECVTPHPIGLAPGDGGFRPCTHIFQVPTSVHTPPCSCGRESIGRCNGCEKHLCGRHGSGNADFLCAECMRKQAERKFAREQEAERDRQAGLIDFTRLLTEAGGSAGDTPDPPGPKVAFARIWTLATEAMLARNPPADLMVVDDLRAGEMPERWPKRGGRRRRERREARWSAAADGLAIAAWDMRTTFSQGSGVADTYSRQEIPLYLGGNGVVYVGAGQRSPGGTHYGGPTYRTPDAVPDVRREESGPWGVIDNRHEIAKGFANLVVDHDLEIGIGAAGKPPRPTDPPPRPRITGSLPRQSREVGVPLVLYATRALPTLKRGYVLVRKWNALAPEDRLAAQEQGRRAVLAIMAVKVAATAERSVADPPPTWGKAHEKIRQPGHTEEMARAIVAHLQKTPEATIDGIATAVGAAGGNDSTLKAAMKMAQEDGYIRRSGITFHGAKWDNTEWADRDLIDTPHVRGLETEILAFVDTCGIVSLDHISSELGLEDDAPELRAALERAIYGEGVHWYCNGIYGLPLDRLEGFEPDRDLWAKTAPGQERRNLGGALKELEASVRGLAAALKPEPGADAAGDGPAALSDPRDDGAEDPYEDLRRLQDLHSDGVLTDQEFAAKKAEVLRRI